MKTEIDNIALKAINKFIYYALNYECRPYCHTSGKTYYVPKFITEITWGCSTLHIVEKWAELARKQESGDIDTYGIIIRFYIILDNNCRIKFLNWVLDNYKDEFKLTTNENT